MVVCGDVDTPLLFQKRLGGWCLCSCELPVVIVSTQTCSVTGAALPPGTSQQASGTPPGQMGAYPTGRHPQAGLTLDWGHECGIPGCPPSLHGGWEGLC